MTVPERCTLETDGFTALWYPGRISPEKAIIAVGGASCDERTSVLMSRFIREAGYNVLVLGFYMWKGLPKDLVSIPVDYAERAAKWLKEKKGISKIAMTGTSTGAGYTLLSASLIPEISCVIPVVPYDYVNEGTKQTLKGYVELHRSQYTWHGADVPLHAHPHSGREGHAVVAERREESAGLWACPFHALWI